MAMLFMTLLMYVAGNYVDSLMWYFRGVKKYDDRLIMIQIDSEDKDFSQFKEVIEDIKKDEELVCFMRSAQGIGGMPITGTLGFEQGSISYVFNSVEDMKKAFDIIGVKCDLSKVKNKSLVMSKKYADNLGLKKGDVIDSTQLSTLDNEKFTLDAFIDDDSYICFYVYEDNENLTRAYISSDSLSGNDLKEHIRTICGDRLVSIDSYFFIEDVTRQLLPVNVIFVFVCILLSIILSLTANSIITAYYIERTYEFGVYRALGISKKRIYKKCAAEILYMDFRVIVFGILVILVGIFLLNELLYLPKGQYLPYYSKLGVSCALISNLLVILPMIIINGRKMARANVTDF